MHVRNYSQMIITFPHLEEWLHGQSLGLVGCTLHGRVGLLTSEPLLWGRKACPLPAQSRLTCKQDRCMTLGSVPVSIHTTHEYTHTHKHPHARTHRPTCTQTHTQTHTHMHKHTPVRKEQGSKLGPNGVCIHPPSPHEPNHLSLFGSDLLPHLVQLVLDDMHKQLIVDVVVTMAIHPAVYHLSLLYTTHEIR